MNSAFARRPPATALFVSAVARRLTPRDRLLCQVLFDHKVLTTVQVADLCFANLTTARHRLTALYELRVLDRFRPFRPVGSDPYHYDLDTFGVEIVAADRGIEVPLPGLHHSRALALSDSQRLAHLLATNGLFCALARWARTRRGRRTGRVVVRAALRHRVGRGRPPRRVRDPPLRAARSSSSSWSSTGAPRPWPAWPTS